MANLKLAIANAKLEVANTFFEIGNIQLVIGVEAELIGNLKLPIETKQLQFRET